MSDSISIESISDTLETQDSNDAKSMIELPISSTITNIKKTKISITTDKQQMIQQFKLNHGLFLNGSSIEPSKQAIIDSGYLDINVFEEEPVVYTSINDPLCPTNLLAYNNINVGFNYNIQLSDVCINFPIAEITYKGNLLESFSKCTDNEKKLHMMYGHFLAMKFLVGGQLFIKGINLSTSEQIDVLKFDLFKAYNSAKYSRNIPFNNIFDLNLLPRIETLDGKKLSTHEELSIWMNNLYQKKVIEIISYEDIIPISQLRDITFSSDIFENFNEKQPGIANFGGKLSLEDWVGDSLHDNLMSWASNYRLFQGLVFNKNNEIEISKKFAINFIDELPKVKQSDKNYLKAIKPSTKLEVNLISNNILTIKNFNSHPFIKSNVKSYGNYNHVLIKFEKYEIFLNKDNIKLSKEFEESIEKALDSMNPFEALQDIFNEYGHFFPLKIVLGRSLKSIIPNNSSNTINDHIDLKPPIFESIKPHLDKLNISYFLTQKGNIVEENNLSNWINNSKNLEIIEFDNIIPLYEVLKAVQRKKIEKIFVNDFKIIMTGITDLRDLNNNNVEYYKHINVEPTLDDDNYRVFGSIISKNYSKLEEFFVNFGLCEFNGFYAIISKLIETSINISECYVLWMIVGNPSKLSVFSPNNRVCKVTCFEKSITYQPNKTKYYIEPPLQLSRGYVISVHTYDPSTDYEHIVKLDSWKHGAINVQMVKPTIEVNDIDISVCILTSVHKRLKIDVGNEISSECSFDLLGYILTENNYNEN
ncbi:14787_t:CDS:1 [Funneliformis caledonium]|uniref:14787_t:CDS:1 n=1 Tax=Funneliformis caledonium TaxID=1117310 RepID=A0A9N8W6F8_9GLOM|nr:14787_t:CDS:1 [Funneliformis caledonium]